MLGHRNNKTGQQKPATPAAETVNRWDAPRMQNNIEEDLDKLHENSRKGLWSLIIFLAVSIAVFFCRDLTLTGCLSTAVRAQLGAAPPGTLIDILQLVSTFSSLIIIAGKIYDGRTAGKTWTPGSTWMHLAFRLVFYPLYFTADSLGAHFDFVFVSGLVVLALQHYNIWHYYSLAIENKMTVWDNLSACNRGMAGK